MFITEKYYPMNAFRICADKVDEDVAGRVFTPLKSGSISFSGMGELLVKMDELFDHVGYPQAFQDKRSFESGAERLNLYRGIPQSEMRVDEIIGQKGKCKTFDVVVDSRRNTSWQGSVYMSDGAFVKEFNGEIEMLECIINCANV